MEGGFAGIGPEEYHRTTKSLDVGKDFPGATRDKENDGHVRQLWVRNRHRSQVSIDNAEQSLMAERTTTQREDSGGTSPPWQLFLIVALVALVATLIQASSLNFITLQLLVALVSLVGGALIGFIFGIPRVPEERRSEAPTSSMDGYRPSTSLEQIADWLTKALIGITLVEVENIKKALLWLGTTIAQQSGEPTAAVAAPVVVLLFAVVGFVPSYIWTRIYYPGLLTWSDVVVQDLRRRLENQKKKTKGVKAFAERNVSDGAVATPDSETTKAVKTTESVVAAPSGADSAWSPELRRKVEQFRNAPANWDSDPGARFFDGARSSSSTRQLSVEMTNHAGSDLELKARLTATGGAPLTGAVTFLLHPTYREREKVVKVEGAAAELTFFAAGRFTLVALADNGDVLTFDLALVPGAPQWFIEN